MKVEEVFKTRYSDTNVIEEWRKCKHGEDPLIEGWKDRIKREHAFAVIRYEYATHGHETRESMGAYVENRISMTRHNKAVREGLGIYEKDKL